MTATLAVPVAPETTDTRDAWAAAVPVLIGGMLAVLLLFHGDAADMARIWWTSSTFEHCLFILPLIGWLVWQRAPELARLCPRGWAPGLLIVAAGAAGWLLGQAAGVAIARHFGLVLMLQGAIVATLGPAVARGLLFPLCYAFFLVPAGEGLVPPLQAITAQMCMALLHLFGIAARLDGIFITTAHGWFEVAEACSGAKFLIAMVALGALAANVCFRSIRRRIAFMALAIVIPVLANGVRAFGTILVANYTDTDVAGSFDHVVYGWVFFAVVIGLLLGLSWRFFDRAPDDPAFDPARIEPIPPHADPRRRVVVAVTAVLIAAAPAAWTELAASGGRLAPAVIALPSPTGWTPVPATNGLPWAPRFPGADRFALAHYRAADGTVVDLAIAAYGDQEEGHEVVGYGIGAVDPQSRWTWGADGAKVADGRAMRIVGPGDTPRDVLIFYRIGTLTTGSETRVKLETLRARLTGAPQRAVAVILSAQAPRGGTARPALDRFRAAIGPIDALADRATR
ncbi:exosortase A [Sphingomonas prati]|uniref:Exosortase A n=1 Tax=Sphingomonas prati TaxID=1843237 RepID=A0A7W9F0U0_9SPHN|nr:exosortase A [Sphingomonas prati]MBB5728598.1 exosortase A [Sphingomonas prati]GGE72543.1 exosortase A [Sphingomonas prati]